MARHTLWCSILVLLLAGTASGQPSSRCEVHGEDDPVLCEHEPNTVGYTRDSDDSSFMDFNISLQYQLFPIWMTKGQNWLHEGLGDGSALYFAFTGRFGQYIGTRDSSPVVSKRFNPKLFYRYWTDTTHESYVDFAFLAHESNGQSIDSAEEYQAAVSTSKDPSVVNDQLSRGWDYVGLDWKHTFLPFDKWTLCTYAKGRYFLRRGPLQGAAEEFNPWEGDPQGKPRSHVNGIAGMVKLVRKTDRGFFHDLKFVLGYETGYRQPLRYNTYRFETGTKFLQLPLTVWWQVGYNSDLAQYYKKVRSYGIQTEIGSF